jgi:hypothetical protein
MDKRFGTWNVRSLYRAGSLRTVAEERSKYKLDLLGVQEVRWGGGCTEPAGEYTFFYGKGNENHELGAGFSIHKRITSAVKRVELVSDRMSYIMLELASVRMSYIMLRGHSCDIIVLNVHAPSEDKIDDMKDRLYEELEHVFDKFPKYHMRVVNFGTSKNLTVKSTMFPHRNIHKFTWASHDGKTHNQIHHILIDRRRHSSIPDVHSFQAADCATWWWQRLGKDWH